MRIASTQCLFAQMGILWPIIKGVSRANLKVTKNASVRIQSRVSSQIVTGKGNNDG